MLVPVRRWRLLALVVTVFFLAAYLLYNPSRHAWPGVATTGRASSLLKRQQDFWRSLHADIVNNAPQCPDVEHAEAFDLKNSIGYQQDGPAPDRPDRLKISTTQVQELRQKHQAFTSTLQQAQYTLPFMPKTRGIVTTAGGKYLPVAVLSVHMLRETGCKLPVEVFLATQDEWDPEICENVFPRLNTRCVVLDNIFDNVHQNETLKIDKYQYKILSVVFSSFEEVMFIDSDCLPIHNPTEYFDSEPFIQTGMILWPDFWYPSEHPSFFEIAGIPVPQLSSRPATESGELFYAKPKHTNSLLLALYYNVYGPGYYYKLQSQGALGEGDKETFLWSAVVFNESFYSVHRPVEAMGYTTTNGQWRGSAMVQFDPIQDVHHQQQMATKGEGNVNIPIRPLFIHANYPKIDPGEIFLHESFGAVNPTIDADGTLRRAWHKTEEETVSFFGFDVERRLWHVVKDIACGSGKFQAWEGLTGVCKKATDYWNTVFDDKPNNALG